MLTVEVDSKYIKLHLLWLGLAYLVWGRMILLCQRCTWISVIWAYVRGTLGTSEHTFVDYRQCKLIIGSWIITWRRGFNPWFSMLSRDCNFSVRESHDFLTPLRASIIWNFSLKCLSGSCMYMYTSFIIWVWLTNVLKTLFKIPTKRNFVLKI